MILTTAVSTQAVERGQTEQDTYRLVWSDEFDVDGKPDPQKWNYEKGFVRNHELQWYQPENAFCANGKLLIEGRREHKPNPDYQENSSSWKQQRKNIDYTASSLTTRGLHAWQYGRFEVKARIAAKNGLWPAIWFLGQDGNWPENGEIDLMEYYQGQILANACWGGKPKSDGGRLAEWDSVKKSVRAWGDPAWDQKFHVWRMDWDQTSISLYLDDELLNAIDLSKTLNHEGCALRNPFHQPFYLLLNLAIGGDNGGDPSDTAFPTRYEIDYVRVYQRTSFDAPSKGSR